MAGIYIHIPFCKQACIYCNFHFSTSLKTKQALLQALKTEIALRKDYTGSETVKTIYFGGGTPSLLTAPEIAEILSAVKQNFSLDADPEITLEANPDDLSESKLFAFREAGINRLSIGIQSFHDQSLQFINRAHNAEQAINCLDDARKAGFSNITIDLIYGIPGITEALWMDDLQTLKSLDIPHFSAYALTVEAKTALDKWIRAGRLPAVDDNTIARHFDILQQWCSANGYLPYEISNYCKPGWESRHNSAYWEAEKYVGFGPSAHSFDGETRQWNIADNIKYIKHIAAGMPFFEKEFLSEADKCNEYVMTSLRTMSGCDLEKIEDSFGSSFCKSILNAAKPYLLSGWLDKKEQTLILTQSGKLFADRIISDLFIIYEADETTIGA